MTAVAIIVTVAGAWLIWSAVKGVNPLENLTRVLQGGAS